MITRRAVALFSITAVALASCATAVSREMKLAAIAKLKAAKELDEQISNDPSADPAEQFDALEQKQKAEHTIRELEFDRSMSESEIDDASEVPPRVISQAQKQQLAERRWL